MARKKRSPKATNSFDRWSPLLAITVGVIFFTLQLLYLMVGTLSPELAGLLTALWAVSGVLLVIGVIMSAQGSKWGLLLITTPALTFALFCALSMLSTFGFSLLTLFSAVATQ